MASGAIQVRRLFSAASKLWRFLKIGLMTTPAGRLQITCRQNGFLPGQRGFMGFRYFRRGSLSAVACGAPPLPHMVRHGRMRAKRLRYGVISQGWLGNSLVTGRAAVREVHPRQPDLIDVWAVIGQ